MLLSRLLSSFMNNCIEMTTSVRLFFITWH